MTREEAKRRLLDIERCTPIHTREDARDFKALEMAIESLSTESCEELEFIQPHKKVSVNLEVCTDAISRQAVMDAMYDLCGEESLKDNPWRDNPHIDSITDAIEHLPSVTPKQKMGRWIYTGDYITDGMLKCSECGFEHDVSERFSYCPNCGAKMEESEDTDGK